VDIAVIGTGHVGLPTAAALARMGHRVTASDNDADRIEALARGMAPFFEPGMRELVDEGTSSGRLVFTPDVADAVRGVAVVFICVGTPPRASGDADLSAVERVAECIAENATGPLVVAEKSTVPAGTADRVLRTLERAERAAGTFEVVSNPEFMREGHAIEDSLEPSRILIGSDSDHALAVMREVYRPLLERGTPLIETDVRSAELAKHACNAFLALKVSFANGLARICERAGADVRVVADVMGTDTRIGRAHLDAGLGYGGYCFPKDLAAFERLAERLGYPFPLLGEVARLNEEAVTAVFRLIEEAVWNLEDKRVVLLGLAFKPGTDDIRFSPAVALGERLLAAGAQVVGYDPQAGANAREELPGLDVRDDLYEALHGAHCAVVCTAWSEIRDLDVERCRDLMAVPVIVDGRNALDRDRATDAGIVYVAVGRPQAVPALGA
jgi:UDPglucose 6-dehydrogenase